MNRTLFAVRNVRDKLGKTLREPARMAFYWRTYVTARCGGVSPDAFVVSYPKCGRTWLRMICARTFTLQGMPDAPFRDRALLRMPGGGVLKFEHDQGNWVPAPVPVGSLSFDRAKYAGKKVVFLVRDPRDVLVSSWYHLTRRERIFRGDLSRFVRDDLVGIRKVVAFMNLWLEHRSVPAGFLTIRYEELHRDACAAAGRVLEFLGCATDGATLRRAVADCAFENMKRMEAEGRLDEPWMRRGADGSEDAMKVRRGIVGGYRGELSGEDLAYVNEVMRQTLSAELPYGR